MAQDTPEVTEYIRLAQALTLAAAEYAGEEFSDRETNAMLSKVQVITVSLQQALDQTRIRASQRPFPPVPGPPQPGPPEVDPEPEPETKKWQEPPARAPTSPRSPPPGKRRS